MVMLSTSDSRYHHCVRRSSPGRYSYSKAAISPAKLLPPYEDTRTREIVMSKSSYLVGHPIYLPKRRNGYCHGSTLSPVRDQPPKSCHLIGHIVILIRRKVGYYHMSTPEPTRDHHSNAVISPAIQPPSQHFQYWRYHRLGSPSPMRC